MDHPRRIFADERASLTRSSLTRRTLSLGRKAADLEQ
jgi:hypothetical protein